TCLADVEEALERALRRLGLAERLVVVSEVHPRDRLVARAVDLGMNGERLLEERAGFFGAPCLDLERAGVAERHAFERAIADLAQDGERVAQARARRFEIAELVRDVAEMRSEEHTSEL